MITFELTETQKETLKKYKRWTPDYLLEWIYSCVWRPTVRSMINYKISEALLDEMDEYSEVLKNDSILHNKLDTNEKIRYAKAKIKEHKSVLKTFSTDIYSEIMNAINDIADDRKFVKSDEGKLILASEDWVEEVAKAMPYDMKETIKMGIRLWRNSSIPVNIVIGGYSKKMTDSELENYFIQLNPPVKPFFLFMDGTADDFIKPRDEKKILAANNWVEEIKNTMPDDMKKNIEIGIVPLNDEKNPVEIIIGGFSKTMSVSDLEIYFMSLNPPVKPSFLFFDI